MRRLLLLLWSCLLLAACDAGSSHTPPKKDIHVDPLTTLDAKLAFTCVHERIPDASAESDVLFQYARWLQKNNQLKEDKSVNAQIERLYRIAAENGHYKATINLQNGAMRGQFSLRGADHLRLSQQLIDAQVATGYYFVAIFLQQGAAGLQQDQDMALRYYRKAADMGSANAQAYVGDKLASTDFPDIARQMRRCAAEQGHGESAVMLSIYLKDEGRYQEALELLQMGIVAGNESATSRLKDAFRGPPPSNKLDYLGQQEDLERAERYNKIWRILANYSYASPKVPEINEILPLPPAKLPPWDGKLQWLEAREANIPPQKPSEALIEQLAKAQQLDPATGKAKPGSPAFVRLEEPLQICASGEACPQSGYWEVHWLVYDRSRPKEIRRFKQGEILPAAVVLQYESRIWPLSPKRVWKEGRVGWQLIGEV